jgi:hypothetical protein
MKKTFLVRVLLIAAAVTFIGCAGGPEDPAKTARFDTFFRSVLAGHAPTQGLTPAMQQALTPAALSQIDSLYATCGTFEKLQYVGEDSVQGYDRFHYAAIFDKGKQGVMFVLDSSGNIAGFFKDQ